MDDQFNPLVELKQLEGWKILQQYIDHRKNEYASKIIKSDPTNAIGIARCQGVLMGLDLVLNKVNTTK